jgi:release factor glutamine methyltransferase
MVYEPREDSYLLQEWVVKLAHGHVLDMGTGSGILALAALEHAKHVTAVDLDEEAVSTLDLMAKRQGLSSLSAMRSDLFAAIKGKFDVIVFNPPYLPSDPRVPDIALDGGPNGWEVVGRFLAGAPKHLRKNGFVLLLFSSLTNQLRVNDLIHKHKMQFEQLAKLNLEFEELYVYRIWPLKA